jgi:hypothetical protein
LICCQKCRANACRAIAIRAVHPHSKKHFKNRHFIQLRSNENLTLKILKENNRLNENVSAVC